MKYVKKIQMDRNGDRKKLFIAIYKNVCSLNFEFVFRTLFHEAQKHYKKSPNENKTVWKKR